MSSSLQKLTIFLKENNHDVIDYWTFNNSIQWIKVISRRGGEIYFINVSSYEISLERSNDHLLKNNSYVLLDNHDPQYLHYAKTFKSIFHTRHLVFFGNEIYDSRLKWYVAQNVPRTNTISIFTVIELDWFYDNSFVVSHEVSRTLSILDQEGSEFIHQNLLQIYSFIKDTSAIKQHMSRLVQEKKKHDNQLVKCQKLYISICKSKTDTYSELLRLEDMIQPDDMTFRSAIHRQYLRKKFNDKMDKLENIQSDTLANISLYSSLKWNSLLQMVHLVSSIRHHIQSIYTIVQDANTRESFVSPL